MAKYTIGLLLVLGLGEASPGPGQKKTPNYRELVQQIVKQGRGSAEGRKAWEIISQGGAEVVPFLFEGLTSSDSVAYNWLVTAYDRVLDRLLLDSTQPFSLEPFLKVVRDPKSPGKARRLALETVEKVKPGTTKVLARDWLEDPEFRHEGVALALEKAKAAAKAGEKEKATTLYLQAFQASRDVLQGREASAGLLERGLEVSVARHLGFLTEWYLIGPFPGLEKRALHTIYAPEKKVDLTEELEGQGKKVRWIRYTVKEPAAKSGAKHQALVDLRARNALGDADDAVAFAYTEFTLPTPRSAEFRGAADDYFVVYVNGKKEFAFEEYQNGVRLDRHRFRVDLKAGKNTVLVKIYQHPPPNPQANWEFFLRIVDETGKGIDMKNTLPEAK